MQPEVAKFTRICTYDPSGTAWSDLGPELTCLARVKELHAVLQKAAITGPYVLVGFSAGAIVARLYAKEYPAQSVGMVMVSHAFLPPKPRELAVPAAGLNSAPPSSAHRDVAEECLSGLDQRPDALGGIPLVVISTGPIRRPTRSCRRHYWRFRATVSGWSRKKAFTP
jgi:pimeloyl-ACP methyl ester carboxylesterase